MPGWNKQNFEVLAMHSFVQFKGLLWQQSIFFWKPYWTRSTVNDLLKRRNWLGESHSKHMLLSYNKEKYAWLYRWRSTPKEIQAYSEMETEFRFDYYPIASYQSEGVIWSRCISMTTGYWIVCFIKCEVHDVLVSI